MGTDLQSERADRRAARSPGSPRWTYALPSGSRRAKPQVLEAGGVEQRLVELTTLKIAQLHEWVAHDLPDPAAQIGARHRQSLDQTGYWLDDECHSRLLRNLCRIRLSSFVDS
jgi:hypothetical protein